MGSGHFLTSAIDYLAREIIDAQEKQAAQQGIETVNEDHDINWARRKVAQRCIYGVDLNPLAVELAKVSLWLRTLAAEQPLAFLDHHLKSGNSLVGSDIEDVLSQNDDTTESGQLTLQQSFAHTRQQALEHVMERFTDLLSIDNETLADIKQMEDAYDDVRDDDLYQHLLAMANVHTAEEFGLQMSPAMPTSEWLRRCVMTRGAISRGKTGSRVRKRWLPKRTSFIGNSNFLLRSTEKTAGEKRRWLRCRDRESPYVKIQNLRKTSYSSS